MKFCAGWFDGEIWLNQTQDGTSFGVYEISAKNSNVPIRSRMRAKTSLQALCLSVRATASDSNAKAVSFNQLLWSHPPWLSQTTYETTGNDALSGLRTRPETDNCASALWLFPCAEASLLLRSECCCFEYRATNIRLVRCRSSRVNHTTQQTRAEAT